MCAVNLHHIKNMQTKGRRKKEEERKKKNKQEVEGWKVVVGENDARSVIRSHLKTPGNGNSHRERCLPL